MHDSSLEQNSHKPITINDLREFFSRSGKAETAHRYGLECELFGVLEPQGAPLPYFGSRGVEGVLQAFVEKFRWKPVMERGHVIALERGHDSITLEPGGQIELSASAVTRLGQIQEQIRKFHEELKSIGHELGIRWLSVGVQPAARSQEMPWVPKARYEVMRRYLACHGERSHDMMQRTATNQLNVDYADEADAMEKMRLVYRITPFITAAFAHSPIFEGKQTGYRSYRTFIWQGTDPARTGMLADFLQAGATFEHYLTFLLKTPTFFIVRDGESIPTEGLLFGRYLEKGFGSHRATWEDFKLHLTTVFPECRLKDHLEIRGMDAQAPEFIIAACAFWKGILRTKEVRASALAEVEEFQADQILEFYRSLPRTGLSMRTGRQSGWEIAQAIFKWALFGLESGKDTEERGERKFLEPFFERFTAKRLCPADEFETLWQKSGGRVLHPALSPVFL